MEGSIELSCPERKRLLEVTQRGKDVKAARRANVLLLLAEGWSVRKIQKALFCSADLVVAVRERFAAGGVEEVLERSESPARPFWYGLVDRWVRTKTPPDFGFLRSRWTCSLLAELLWQEQRVQVSAEAVRRALHALGLVWRRPRPVVGPQDPDHAAKMQEIRRLLASLPPEEVALFQDEVQIDLNPKIGSAWMAKGEQQAVVTPGDNVSRHIAASLAVGTGLLLASSPGTRRNSDLFIEHLADLCWRLRRWKVIHVFCDNAAFHKSQKVQAWLAEHGGRIRLHYLPARAPEENPIERVFWRLHEAVTRNHRAHSIAELLEKVEDFWKQQEHYYSSVAPYSLAA
jgi:putative transposase